MLNFFSVRLFHTLSSNAPRHDAAETRDNNVVPPQDTTPRARDDNDAPPLRRSKTRHCGYATTTSHRYDAATHDITDTRGHATTTSHRYDATTHDTTGTRGHATTMTATTATPHHYDAAKRHPDAAKRHRSRWRRAPAAGAGLLTVMKAI